MCVCVFVEQIEAALSRMPRSGGKVSLQTRLDEVRHQKSFAHIDYVHINFPCFKLDVMA